MTATQEQCYQYQVIELRRNIDCGYTEATAQSERAARRLCRKDCPEGEYKLHLVWHGPVNETAHE